MRRPIDDRVGLARWLRPFVEAAGSQADAAKRYRVPQSVISRLLTFRRGALAGRVVERLRAMPAKGPAGDETRRALEACFTPPAADAIRLRYIAWRERSMVPSQARGLVRVEQSRDFQALLGAIFKSDLAQRVEQACAAAGEPERDLLIWWRVIEPLVQSWDSAQVEPTLGELYSSRTAQADPVETRRVLEKELETMSPGLEKFLRRGVQRELWLLRRRRKLAPRIRAVASGG